MYTLLVTLVIALFIAMLFLNLYFRMKVLKVYKVLVKNEIQFGTTDILSKSKMENEVIPKYPKFETEIRTFVQHIQYSIKMATVLIAIITLFGAILMYYR